VFANVPRGRRSDALRAPTLTLRPTARPLRRRKPSSRPCATHRYSSCPIVGAHCEERFLSKQAARRTPSRDDFERAGHDAHDSKKREQHTESDFEVDHLEPTRRCRRRQRGVQAGDHAARMSTWSHSDIVGTTAERKRRVARLLPPQPARRCRSFVQPQETVPGEHSLMSLEDARSHASAQ
jgi:hypothetical protein